MARPGRHPSPLTCELFVVERYLPGFSLDRLVGEGGWAPRGPERDMAGTVRHLESTWIPGDETVISTFIAPSAETLAAALVRGGQPADRIVGGVRYVPDPAGQLRKDSRS